jgi:hypothetical protein
VSAEQLPDLDEFLTDALAPDTAISDVWTPTSEGEADWAARKILRARQTIAAKRAEAQRIIDETQRWLDKVTAEHERTATFLESRLAAWLTAEIAADESKKPRKSRELPCGAVVRQTAGRASLVVDDETAFVDWAVDHAPHLVSSEVVWSWSKADVKKAFDATKPDDLGMSRLVTDGEPVPGVHVETSPDAVKVVTP